MKKKKNNNVVDISQRRKMKVDELEGYDEKEILELLEEINKQMEEIEKLYYSSNALIDRINKRTVFDILHDKFENIQIKNNKESFWKRILSRIIDDVLI